MNWGQVMNRLSRDTVHWESPFSGEDGFEREFPKQNERASTLYEIVSVLFDNN